MPMLRYKIYSENGEISFRRPIMVLIHGLGGGYANWHRQVHPLRAAYDLVLIELPSHGRSPVKMSELEPSYDVLSEKIMEVVDHLGIQKASFAGISLGTMLVKHIVLHYPDRVDKYILTGPVGQFAWWLRAVIALVRTLLPVLPLNMVCKLVATFLMPFKVSKYGRDVFLACAKKLPKKEIIAWCRLLTKFKGIQRAYHATMGDEPNGLYLVGKLDHFFIPMLKRDRKRVKHMVFIHNAGHACVADQAEIVNRHIMTFMDTGTACQEACVADANN